MRAELWLKLSREILKYENFDAAHNIDHVEAVIERTKELCNNLDINCEMAITTAVYHDLGLSEDRATHHLISGRILREDKELKKFFNEDQIEIMAQAVEDHRASGKNEPRNIYGKIVSDADRIYDFDTIISRCIKHRNTDDFEEGLKDTVHHIKEKYATGGYLPDFYFLEKDKKVSAKLDKFAYNELFARKEFSRIWNKNKDELK